MLFGFTRTVELLSSASSSTLCVLNLVGISHKQSKSIMNIITIVIIAIIIAHRSSIFSRPIRSAIAVRWRSHAR
jgi:hypothetical protein